MAFFMESLTWSVPAHRYSFACVGLKKVHARQFLSRNEANEYMHKICAKYGLTIHDVWDDHHDKTYCCQDGIKFFIHRV